MAEENAVTSADLTQAEIKVDRSVKARRDSDRVLINYWLYFFLVSWITFGIYALVLFFQRINRVDRFSERKHSYYDALITWTERHAQQERREDEVHHELGDLKADVDAAYRDSMRDIKPGLSLALTIVTLGIYGFYVLYRVNRYWWDAQLMEQEFDDSLSHVWLRLGLMRYPLSFALDQRKRRSYPFYLILSIVTFGVWAIVWDYQIHTDPENLYDEFHANEDTMLQAVRAH